MAGDVAREGNLLDFSARNRATDASLIEKPQYITDDQRRYLRVGPDGATPVTDASGAAIQMPQAATTGQITPAMQYEQTAKTLQALIANPPMTADPAYDQQVASVRQQLEGMTGGQKQGGKAVVKTGMLNGRKVVQYADGTTEYAE